jgi:hypothetical protein
MTADDAIQRLIDIEDIRQLKARYIRFMDTQQWEALRDVVTDDMRFEAPSGTMTSAEEFISTLASRLTGKVVSVHHALHPEITITGPDTATGVWALCHYARPVSGGAGARMFAHYADDYVRTGDGWRIKNVVITMIGREELPASG